MSSSNLVEVAFIEETVLGETPGGGDFDTARFINESLSGTPETTESAQIRTDRYASGQIVTGLTVGGELAFELAKEAQLEKFIASAMLSDWDTTAQVVEDFDINATAKTLTRGLGDWDNDVEVGDFITLSGFTDPGNNVVVMVAEIVSATVLRYVGPEGMDDEVGNGSAFRVADKISIGTSKKSFSMQKQFKDLTNKAIIYKGMLVSTMSLSISYGEIINGSFGFSGTQYQTVSGAANFITNSRTVKPPATTNSMNGSIDMPFIASSAVGNLEEAVFCIQSAEISLDNNLTAQTCIGEVAPKDYSPGTAAITISLTAYLSDDNWDILGKKLTQTPFSIGFMVQNDDGWYGFYMPAIQVSFEDPASPGANQDVFLNMEGVARVGLNGEAPFTMYRIPA